MARGRGREAWVALVEENLTFAKKKHSSNVTKVDLSLLDDSGFPCVSNINTLWLIVDWKLAKSISFDARLVLLWWICNWFTSTAVLKVPFPFKSLEITSTRWKSPLELTFTTYRQKHQLQKGWTTTTTTIGGIRQSAEASSKWGRKERRIGKDGPLFFL